MARLRHIDRTDSLSCLRLIGATLWILCTAIGGPIRAQPENEQAFSAEPEKEESNFRSPIVEKSPFLPPDFNLPQEAPSAPPPTAPARATNNLEFKGVYQINGEYKFNIFDGQTQKGTWLGLNETKDGFEVIKFHPEGNSIDIQVAGGITNLAMAVPNDKPMAVASTPSGNVTTANNNQPPTPPEPVRRRVVPLPPQARNNSDSNPRRRVVVPPRRNIPPPQPDAN